jgi:hypothetical protein
MIKKTMLMTMIAAATVGAFAVGTVKADPKHDSNTLHKIGNAIQYPVRKAGENLSIATHRTEGKKSVTSLRPQKATAVITPNGKQYVIHHRGNAVYAHHHHHVRHHVHHKAM